MNKMTSKISLIGLLLTTVYLSNTANAGSTCWKNTETRGVGLIPGNCDEGQMKSGLLCYEKCQSKNGVNMSVVAGVCAEKCPDGWRDDGAFCNKPAVGYTRGALWFSMENCNMWTKKPENIINFPNGCEKSWGAIYPKCKPGYVADTASHCSLECPTTNGKKWNDIGISCAKPDYLKNSYIVKPITPKCAPGMVYDAGLCYKPCSKSEFTGVGPVCWEKCPADLPTDCGAMCGKTWKDCASAVGQQVIAVGNAIAKITALITTAGTSAAAEASAIAALKQTIAEISKAIAKSFGKQLISQVAMNDLIPALKQYMPEEWAKKIADMIGDPEGYDYKAMLRSLDPTGLANAVKAFELEMCMEHKS